jgi:hypothetical protein
MTLRWCANLVALVALSLALPATPATAQLQRSMCADCHFANLGGPSPRHLADWDVSSHSRNDVGCEKCHGGNPATVESFAAHQTIVRGRGLDSPINPRNLPRTCGACHQGPFVEFQTSKHYLLLLNGDPSAPTCSTCHGTVETTLLSPKGLESQCNECHGRGKKDARPEFGANARILMTQVRETRSMLDNVKPLIKRVKDENLRSSLQYDYDQAQVPLKEAVYAGHTFVFGNLEERLLVARNRADALIDRIANVGAKPAAPR